MKSKKNLDQLEDFGTGDNKQNKSALIANLSVNEKYQSLIIENEDDACEQVIYTINKRYIDNELNKKTDEEFEKILTRFSTDVPTKEIIYAIKSRLKQNVEILMIKGGQIMLRNIEDNRKWSENIKGLENSDKLKEDDNPVDDVRGRKN